MVGKIFSEFRPEGDWTAGPFLVWLWCVHMGVAVIFKTLNDYSAFVMENPDHPAHEAVRNRLLKERQEGDAKLRASVRRETRQVRPAPTVEVHTTV
jgi:hypothetical protein